MAVVENPLQVRNQKPPRLCPACGVGANEDTCWWCGGPMRRVAQAMREIRSAMAWP